ncbi:flavodoxin [Clostridium cellulovorans]|uniref:Flavodoxin-like domain-containing protein n=1 Tax=Clostridium cellulovorans (strain ATCC 35296 / DSM 3052 / OCM 3 / 743B) TaxID=573061 RepID=D9SW75_CLOC7|nr:flavodoxin [Clostridium cellulovorans]ADL51219.1 hypothetical protein Clocel_1466 [Clostridium cellulovorans 743B]
MGNLKEANYLIAYYSRKGNNYVSGKIVDLPVGNTEVAANIIEEIIGGELFHIDTVQTYPKDYTETTNVAKRELNSNARPELADYLESIDAYDVIFLGYPNWWGTAPMAVFTFLEEHDFSGKTIIPFCTHEGSGFGHSEKDIAEACPNATILQGLAIHGTSVNFSKKDIANWLNKNGVI